MVQDWFEVCVVGAEQERLESVRDQLETEIDDLTANLFEVCSLEHALYADSFALPLSTRFLVVMALWYHL